MSNVMCRGGFKCCTPGGLMQCRHGSMCFARILEYGALWLLNIRAPTAVAAPGSRLYLLVFLRSLQHMLAFVALFMALQDYAASTHDVQTCAVLHPYSI